jgi:hypothetical protein
VVERPVFLEKGEMVMNTKKATTVGKYAQLRTGLAVVLNKTETLQVLGEEMKVGDFLNLLDELGTHSQTTEDAKAAYRRAVAAEQEAQARVRPKLSALRLQLQGRLSPEQLATCGIPPRKSLSPLTPDERTARTLKIRATRASNRTLGKRQVRQEKAKATISAAYASNGSGAAPDAHASGGSGGPAVPLTVPVLPRDGGSGAH